MDLSEPFKYGIFVGAVLVLISNARIGPEINRRLTNLGGMVFGASLLGWAVASKPLADGALAGLGMIVTAAVAMLGIGSLLWGWWRRRRDREIDAGVLPDDRVDPLSQVRRQRAEQQIRARFEPRTATAHSGDGGVEAAARACRSHAMVLVVLGAALMLVPLLFRSVREGTLDGSPTSLLALACIVLGTFLLMEGRRRWVNCTRREQQAVYARDCLPPRR